MEYKTVAEALGALLIFNDPDFSPDYMASKDKAQLMRLLRKICK